jgi:drug/metabolite transporter superfamily protein YnfA
MCFNPGLRLTFSRPDTMKYAIIFALLLAATTLEASGDAIVRIGLNAATSPTRILSMLAGGAILFGYGLTLNLAPLDFGRLIGAYVATFFLVAQIINLLVFRTPPSLPILVGGMFILTGGAIITVWQR